MKISQILKLVTAFTIFAGFNLSANAQSSYKLNENIRIGDEHIKIKEKNSYSLDGWRHVEKIKVKISGDGESYTRKLKIVSNGRDYYPTYENGYLNFPVRAAINNFDLCSDGEAPIDGIYYDYFDSLINVPHGFNSGFSFDDNMVSLISNVARDVMVLTHYVSLQDAQTYIMPIRVQAGNCEALFRGRGFSLGRGGECAKALLAQIVFAKDFINHSFEIGATYEIAERILTLQYRLERALE